MKILIVAGIIGIIGLGMLGRIGRLINKKLDSKFMRGLFR